VTTDFFLIQTQNESSQCYEDKSPSKLIACNAQENNIVTMYILRNIYIHDRNNNSGKSKEYKNIYRIKYSLVF
jgi:hypothetical protein